MGAVPRRERRSPAALWDGRPPQRPSACGERGERREREASTGEKQNSTEATLTQPPGVRSFNVREKRQCKMGNVRAEPFAVRSPCQWRSLPGHRSLFRF